MQDEVQNVLSILIGQPLSDMWRYVGYQRFEFGVQYPSKNRRGQHITVSDWAMVVACTWRIERANLTVVSSNQFSNEGIRKDDQAKPFYELVSRGVLIVNAIQAFSNGGFSITMAMGYILTVLPDGISGEAEWRLIFSDENRNQIKLVNNKIWL